MSEEALANEVIRDYWRRYYAHAPSRADGEVCGGCGNQDPCDLRIEYLFRLWECGQVKFPREPRWGPEVRLPNGQLAVEVEEAPANSGTDVASEA